MPVPNFSIKPISPNDDSTASGSLPRDVHSPALTPAERARLKGHAPAVIWFTGLSGSGKSTLANAVESRLHHQYGAHTYLLDGDVIRTGLNSDLGFAEADRAENIRRLGEVTRLFYNAGLIVLTAFISPFRADRERARALVPPGGFVEVYVQCPLAVCEQRDPKGLYRRARVGQLPQFTGVTSPYEAPVAPEITLETDHLAVADCVETVCRYLTAQGIVRELA